MRSVIAISKFLYMIYDNYIYIITHTQFFCCSLWNGFMLCDNTELMILRLPQINCCFFYYTTIQRQMGHAAPGLLKGPDSLFRHFSSHLVPLHFNIQPSSSIILVLQKFLFPSMAVSSVCWLVAMETGSQDPWQTSELLIWCMTSAQLSRINLITNEKVLNNPKTEQNSPEYIRQKPILAQILLMFSKLHSHYN